MPRAQSRRRLFGGSTRRVQRLRLQSLTAGRRVEADRDECSPICPDLIVPTRAEDLITSSFDDGAAGIFVLGLGDGTACLFD